MVSTAALIAALQGQFAAARQGQGGGSTAGLPGLLSSGTGENGSGINALASGGISGGGVPTTATTGQSIASGLGGAAPTADPLAQQVLSSGGLFGSGNVPGERGDLGAGVTGGDVETLLSVLGGPFAIPSVLAALVASTDLGLPPTTNINSLITGGGGGTAFAQSQAQGREAGGIVGGPVSFGSSPGGGIVGNVRSESEIDRGQRTGREAVNVVRQ